MDYIIYVESAKLGFMTELMRWLFYYLYFKTRYGLQYIDFSLTFYKEIISSVIMQKETI